MESAKHSSKELKETFCWPVLSLPKRDMYSLKHRKIAFLKG